MLPPDGLGLLQTTLRSSISARLPTIKQIVKEDPPCVGSWLPRQERAIAVTATGQRRQRMTGYSRTARLHAITTSLARAKHAPGGVVQDGACFPDTCGCTATGTLLRHEPRDREVSLWPRTPNGEAKCVAIAR